MGVWCIVAIPAEIQTPGKIPQRNRYVCTQSQLKIRISKQIRNSNTLDGVRLRAALKTPTFYPNNSANMTKYLKWIKMLFKSQGFDDEKKI